MLWQHFVTVQVCSSWFVFSAWHAPALTLFVERTKTLQHSCVRYLHFAAKLCLALISSNSLSCALKRKVPPSNQCWVGCHDILLVLWILMRAVCQPTTLLFAIVIRNYIFNRPKMQLHKYEVDAFNLQAVCWDSLCWDSLLSPGKKQ